MIGISAKSLMTFLTDKIANCKTANCELVADGSRIIEKSLTRLKSLIIYEDLISSIPLLVDGCAANFSLYSNGGIQTDDPYAAFGGSHSLNASPHLRVV